LKILIKPVAGKSPRIPEYQTLGASGADIFACIERQVSLEAGETKAIPTGFCISLPTGFEAQIRPRSGLALNHNIGLMNSPGTIDSDFRGEVMVIMTNFGTKPFVISPFDRIAQMVILPVEKGEFLLVEELTSSERGNGGFGHTGR
jgi:dUTP pyrophosphatase